MPIVRNRIAKRYLVLCEGKDTENFLISYLNSAALQCDPRFSNDVQTFDFGGVEQLGQFIKNLINMDGYERVERLMVLRDAETNVAQAKREVRQALQEGGLPAPGSCCSWCKDRSPWTAYVLLPSCDATPVPGALEDLCWQVLAGEDSMDVRAEAQQYIERVRMAFPDRIVSHAHKSRLHAYLSASDDYVSLKTGEAARAGAFDWNSPQLASLRDIIARGFEGCQG